MGKLAVVTEADSGISPIGRTVTEAAEERARTRPSYRAAWAEYDAINELRKKNWVAAHIRERRYELGLTQQEVACKAGTSHSYISRVEAGDHLPTIPVLQRILAVLEEELLLGIETAGPGEDRDREIAPVPDYLNGSDCPPSNATVPAHLAKQYSAEGQA